MVLKAVVLLCALSLSNGCSTSLINQIFQMLTSPPTIAPPTAAPPTAAPPTAAPPTAAPPTAAPPTAAPPTAAPPTAAPPTSSCTCGIPNRAARIVNGVVTEVNEYPWQIGLTSSSGGTPWCGGSIISQNSILTAAHCTAGETPAGIFVLVGEHDTDDPSDGTYVTVCAINDHPGYNDNTLENDYSILTLCAPLTYTTEFSPVCLPAGVDGDGTVYEGLDHVVSGWGTTSSGGSQSQFLQEVTVQTMTNAECCSGTNQYGCGQITDVMMCAANPGKDSCQGDSGGPLVTYQDNANYVQTGVVSFGIGCANANYPGVYARVSKVMQWITSVDMTTVSNQCAPNAA